jgi:hypothetical protein
MKTIATALLLAAALTGVAQAQSKPQTEREAAGPTPGPRSGERADIPFGATRSGIRTFTPERGGYGVYLQDNHRDWNYASFFSRCSDLPYAFAYGFQTFGGSSTLSRGDTIVAGRERCRIHDIVRSGPPPEKPRKARKSRKPA